LIKKFIQLLLGNPRTITEPLVRQIAEQSLAEICQLVEGRMANMTLAEARGYVRARATQVVLRESRIAIAKSTDVEFAEMATVARQATERLISQVIRRTHTSAPHPARVAA
jgi:hypothetical protein